jgi:energy-coupling factor transport system ATP-binding protein
MTLLHLDRLSYWYPDTTAAALRDVSWDLDGGATLLTGASGSGKSTLLRVCNGLIPHFHGGRISGHATAAGFDVLRTPTRTLARRVGFLFQDPELQSVYPTVERDVAFGLENAAVPRGEMHARVDEALHRTGISHLRSRAVHTLSGGERQRCALAGVLAVRPSLLALDEPLSQLDPGGTAGLIHALRGLRDSGTALLVAEHRTAALSPLVDAELHIEAGVVGAAPAHADAVTHPQALPTTRPGDVLWSLDAVAAGHGGAPVLHEVTMEGRSGEVLTLTGPNGAGKTTLLRTIAQLLPPLAGTVQRRPGRVAYLPQNPMALLHRATVRDEVDWTLRHEPAPDGRAVLRELGIEHVADRYPRDLSTGEQQRAALAAVLAGAPAIALLDEPTRGMDAAARAALLRCVNRLCAQGCSVVVATHDEQLADGLGGRRWRAASGTVREQSARTPVLA